MELKAFLGGIQCFALLQTGFGKSLVHSAVHRCSDAYFMSALTLTPLYKSFLNVPCGVAGYHISASSVFKSGDLHVCIVHKGLPVTLLEHDAELLSGSDLVRVRELLALRPLVDLVQSLLPLYR